MPPAPMRGVISYEASRVPAASGTGNLLRIIELREQCCGALPPADGNRFNRPTDLIRSARCSPAEHDEAHHTIATWAQVADRAAAPLSRHPTTSGFTALSGRRSSSRSRYICAVTVATLSEPASAFSG